MQKILENEDSTFGTPLKASIDKDKLRWNPKVNY